MKFTFDPKNTAHTRVVPDLSDAQLVEQDPPAMTTATITVSAAGRILRARRA